MRRFFARLSFGSNANGPFADNSQNDSINYQSGNEEQEFWRDGLNTSACSSTSWNPDFASDPTAWEQQFLSYWKQLKKIITSPNSNKMFNEVKYLLTELCNLLIMELNSQPEAIIGPILDHCFNNGIFLCIHEWAIKMPLFLVPMCQVMLLQIYEDVVTRSQSQNHCLLVHKPILIPLLKLLQWCRRSAEERRFQLSNVDKYFVQLLNQICTKIAEDATLLEFFFNPQFVMETQNFEDSCYDSGYKNGSESEEQQPFLVFSFLIPYMYAVEDIGQLARDSLLLIMSVSQNQDFVARHVSENSNFCPVLAGGLSGCFSQLPRCICSALQISEHDEFHKLNLCNDIDEINELAEFHKAVLFCNAVVQVAHRTIVSHIIRYFYDGFLLEVFKSSVLEADSDDLISKIVYFHMCLEIVTEEALIMALLKFLIVAETNVRNMNLLEIILSKLNDSEKLCRVVLSLLKTLIELRCEDLMWNCLIRFILPFIPLKPHSRRFDVNVSLDAANCFLDCIPDCTRTIKELNSEETFECYLYEAMLSIQESAQACKKWAYKYDGTKPNSLFNMNATEELLSTRQPFIRLSSARSSFASTGWNRYFQNRSAHGTQDRLTNDLALTPNLENIPPLNLLGEDEHVAINKCGSDENLDSLLDSAQDDFNDFNLQYGLITDTQDYFQFAYEGISESDESTSRRNSYKEEEEENVKQISPTFEPKSKVYSTAYTAAVYSIDWTQANTRDEFLTILDALPPCDRSFGKSTLEESISLIESRFQYFQELRAEKEKVDSEAFDNNLFKLDLCLKDEVPTDNFNEIPKSGLLLTCTDEKGPGILLESLLNCLDKLVDRNFSTNLQLVGVFNALMSYPQPVITSYLIYIDAIKSNALCRITNIMKNLKMRIDAYASSTDGFAEMLQRGIRHKISRAERFEKSSHENLFGNRRTERSLSTARSTITSSGFRFTHKAMESRERVVDSSRNKNYAYAAIILSQMCQICAAYALQHSAAVEYSSRNGVK